MNFFKILQFKQLIKTSNSHNFDKLKFLPGNYHALNFKKSIGSYLLAQNHKEKKDILSSHSKSEGKKEELKLKPSYKALFVDAAGTLIYPAQPAASIYKKFGKKYGVTLSEEEILYRYRRAFAHPPVIDAWNGNTSRYIGDGRIFWKYIIKESTGCDSDALLEELYDYFRKREAWNVPEEAYNALKKLKDNNIKMAVVSNFDTRLRPLLKTLDLYELFDAIIVSAEVSIEKPNPYIFEIALNAVNCNPSEVIHVGDDRRNDLWGARDAKIDCWLWGSDVTSFHQIADLILFGEHY